MYSAMIVDDYEMYRNEMKSMKVWGDISGVEIADEASNGLDALNKLQRHPVDILITDIRMPVMNGLELLRKVTEEKLCTCVILMSQFSDFEYARQGLSNGAFEYLLKPVNSGELQRVLVNAVSHVNEKKRQISDIKYLHTILTKSTVEYFPDKEFGSLINAISEGSFAALDEAAKLVDITFGDLNYDIHKTVYVISRCFKKLIEAVQIEFSWMNQLVNLQEFRVIDFSRFDELAAIKDSFSEQIKKILTIIRKYEHGIENSNLVRMTCKTILENIDSDLTINEIASRLFITRTYLSQIFKEKTGINLVKYLIDVKIERAKFLISSGSKVNEISEQLGYKDDEYFKKLFKKVTGMTINEFKSDLTQ